MTLEAILDKIEIGAVVSFKPYLSGTTVYTGKVIRICYGGRGEVISPENSYCIVEVFDDIIGHYSNHTVLLTNPSLFIL